MQAGDKRFGCVGSLALLNIFLMGLTALAFSQGPYGNFEQEAWYRYRSIAFFIFGAAIPAALIWLGRESSAIVSGAAVWMAVSLLLFVVYFLQSGGGA